MVNLKDVKKVIGLKIKALALILLALITCTCSGPKLMLGTQSLGKQTDYSSYSGRLVKQTSDVMECAISRIDVQVFRLWHPQRRLIWQPYLPIHGTGYCPNLEPMRRRCSQIKWYQFQSIIHSFSDQYRTVWIDRRQNLPIEFPHQNSPERDSIQKIDLKKWKDWTRPSTGKTRGITPMMERSFPSSSTTKRVNGKNQKTSSTTGGLQKQH